jgi:DNA polymerase III gamma/tau subunit
MSLINKYEPIELNNILGNKDNKTILNGFLKQKKIPQVYLLHGDYGCGKSLIANLFSKKLKCNIQELNASNDRGIDSIRKLLESCNFKSFDGNPKSYIIEECHQLPTLSQEAFLTILQNPPKNCYFFFCTTILEKMLKTIISRSKVIEVNRIGVRELYPYLIDISIKENNEISKSVARKISETSKGHVRDALQLLEIVLQFTDEKKQLDIINNGLEENSTVIDLCRKLNKNSTWNEIKDILKSLQNEDPEKIRRIIISYFSKVLLDKGDKRSALIIDILRNPYYVFEVLICDIYGLYYDSKE